MPSLRARAALFAAEAHEGQVRKYTGEPYFNHCRAVGQLVKQRDGDEFMIAAAYLHDTLEDTDVTVEQLRNNFPPAVVDLVIGLTDVYTSEAYPSLNRGARKTLECARYLMESCEVQTIKLCDLIDNTRSIVQFDPSFAITYLREKANLLEAFDPSVLVRRGVS